MFKVKVTGLQEVRRALAEFSKAQKQAARVGVYRGARIIANEAKLLAPVLRRPGRGKVGSMKRLPGTVKRSITAVRRRGTKETVQASAIVKAAVGTKKGTNSPHDPFYARFLEQGTKKMRAHAFMLPAAMRKRAEVVEVIKRTLVERLGAYFR